MPSLLTRPILALLLTLPLACGESGSRESRPIEVLIRVARPTGAAFRVLGIETATTPHRFDFCSDGSGRACQTDADCAAGSCTPRAFEVPHLFVVENGFQPVTATIQNLDPSVPITVELVFGVQVVTRADIPPGECCIIAQGGTCGDTPTPCEGPADPVRRPEVRFEIVSVAGPVNVGFFATVGDLTGTNITSCVTGTDFCRTPATFFLEDAQDSVSGVFTRFSDQDPDASLRADLYVDDQLRDTATGNGDLVVSDDL